jgi:hypothetical protein
MANSGRRLLAGAPGGLVPKNRARMPRFACHCGCGRVNFFIQPRSQRFGSPAAAPILAEDAATENVSLP